ncbi:MAG: SUF system NifU family Fe-S cluster assembly protein [Anaerolineaceae bacterium]|nr:SUF system NifU family Fe-S cluster assembly protein [Anaerolineaceae bacterium]
MDDLYREIIVDRYKNPRFKGTIQGGNVNFEDENPLCGDQIRIDLKVDEFGTIVEAAYDGHGCAISQASADLLLESVIGKNVEIVKKMTKQDILDMLGIELGPVRLKCALLPLKVIKAGIYGLKAADDSLVDD